MDFNRRFVAAFLALVFALTSLVIGISVATKAEDTHPAKAAPSINDWANLVLDKEIMPGETKGTYDLKLSAYAKGEVRNVTKQTPTDYILIVDQSGSMSYKDMPLDYVEAGTKDWKLSDVVQEHNIDVATNAADSLYYRDPETGEYYRVYKKWGTMYEYLPRNSTYVREVINRNSLSWFTSAGEQEQSFDSLYYYRPYNDPNIELVDPGMGSDKHYYPVRIDVSNGSATYKIRFTYHDMNGNERTMYGYNDPDSYNPNDASDGNAILYHNLAGGGYYRKTDLAYNQINDIVLLIAEGNSIASAVATEAAWAAAAIIGRGQHYPKQRFEYYTYAEFLTFNTGMHIQNPLFIGHVGYNELCYKDSDGVEHKLISTEFCDSNGRALVSEQGAESVWNGTLYKIANVENSSALNTTTRLDALKTALYNFVDTVASQEDYLGAVDHRVAIVGFSSSNNNNYSYNNNEVLTGVELTKGSFIGNTPGTNPYSTDGYNYNGLLFQGEDASSMGGITATQYKNALINTATAERESNVEGLDHLSSAIDGITAYGGTQPEIGFAMARNIITSRNQLEGNSDRNTVVIFFTDGRPGNYDYIDQYAEANDVVQYSKAVKDLNASVYSVGLFNEADGNPLTYPVERNYVRSASYTLGTEPGNNIYKIDNSSPYSSYRIWQSNDMLAEDRGRATFANGYIRQTFGISGNGSIKYNVPQNRSTRDWSIIGGYGPWYWDESRTYNSSVYVYETDRDFYRRSLLNTAGYPEIQNDTIADYMSVTSSEYPQATAFDGGWSTDFPDQRGTKLRNGKENRYYYTATSLSGLTDIFENIATTATYSGTEVALTGSNSHLQDVISSKFNVPADFATNISDYVTVETIGGHQDEIDGEVIFDTSTTTSLSVSANDWDAATKTLSIDGFDYTANYIANGKPQDYLDSGNAADWGKKLVVTIKGLTPVNETGVLPSNDEQSGVIYTPEEAGEEPALLAEFDSPAITKRSYQLHADSNHNYSGASFDLEFLLKDGNNDAVDTDLILIDADSTRITFDDLTNPAGTKTLSGATDGTIVYVEYITAQGKEAAPKVRVSDYYIDATVVPADSVKDSYTYYLDTADYVDPEGQGTDSKLLPTIGKTVGQADNLLTTEDGHLYVSSKSDNRDVIIHLTADPSPFVDDNYEFTVEVTWEKDGQTGSQTLTMPYNNGTIANQTVSVPYGATVTVSHSDYFYDTKISETAGSGTSDPYTATNIVATRDIYITDTARDNIGEGVMEDSNANKVILYVLAGIALLSAGAGAIYIYRKKDVLSE